MFRMLDVFLRGKRNYIQGTQIIARTANLLDENDWCLDNAQFSSITDAVVEVSEDMRDGFAHIGIIGFFRENERRSFYVYPTAVKADRRDIGLSVSVHKQQGNDDAFYSFEKAHNFEDVMNAIVQAVRKEHEEQFIGCYDVWFTGFRRLNLEVAFSDCGGNGNLFIQRKRIMVGADAYQSLWGVRLDMESHAPVDGFVTFSFKPKEDIHVS